MVFLTIVVRFDFYRVGLTLPKCKFREVEIFPLETQKRERRKQ
jgi:hypothetical protein